MVPFVQDAMNAPDRVLSASLRSLGILLRVQVGFKERLKHEQDRCLRDPMPDVGYAQGSELARLILRDQHLPHLFLPKTSYTSGRFASGRSANRANGRNNSLGPDHHYYVESRRIRLRTPTQKDTVQPPKPNPARALTPQDRDLMSQCDAICSRPAWSLVHGSQRHEEHSNERYHPQRNIDVLYLNRPDKRKRRKQSQSGVRHLRELGALQHLQIASLRAVNRGGLRIDHAQSNV